MDARSLGKRHKADEQPGCENIVYAYMEITESRFTCVQSM